jgi:hypothetical protein
MMQLNRMTRLLVVGALGLGLVACGSAPTRPEGTGVVFAKPAGEVMKAAESALAANGFEIQKREPSYVEGFRTRQIGLMVGSGGETSGVWLEPAPPTGTRVRVTTQKSMLGIIGQKNWDDEILAAMEKNLGPRK